MVLPYTPSQRWEVEKGVSGAADVFDVDADIVIIYDGDLSSLDAVPGESSKPHGSFEPPNSYCGVDPVLVTPLSREAGQNVPETSDQDEDGEKNMPSQEELIQILPDGQDGRWE